MEGRREVIDISNGGPSKGRGWCAIGRSDRARDRRPVGLSVGLGTGVDGRRGSPTASRRLSHADRVGRLSAPPSIGRGDGRMLSNQDGSEGEVNDSLFCPSGQSLLAHLGILNVPFSRFSVCPLGNVQNCGQVGNCGLLRKLTPRKTRP
jgi:hypothetical protein